MNIGKALRVAMAIKGMKQKDLAELSGVSETTLSHTILGRTAPTVTTITKLAKAMNISYSDLVKLGED